MTTESNLVDEDVPIPKESISELSSDSSTSIASSSTDSSDSDSDSSDDDEGDNSDILQAILQELSLSLSSSTVTGLSSNKEEILTKSATNNIVPYDNAQETTSKTKGAAKETAQLDPTTTEERVASVPDKALDKTKQETIEDLADDTKPIEKSEVEKEEHKAKAGDAVTGDKITTTQDNAMSDLLLPVASSFLNEPEVIGPPQCSRSPKDSSEKGSGVGTATAKIKHRQRSDVKKESKKTSGFSLLPNFNMFRCTNPNQIANNVNDQEIVEEIASAQVEAPNAVDAKEERLQVQKANSRISLKSSRSANKGMDAAIAIHDRDPSALVHGKDPAAIDDPPPPTSVKPSSSVVENTKQTCLAVKRKKLPSLLSSSASSDVSAALPPLESKRRNRSSPASISGTDGLEKANARTENSENAELGMQSIMEEADVGQTSNEKQECTKVTSPPGPEPEGHRPTDLPHSAEKKQIEQASTLDKKEHNDETASKDPSVEGDMSSLEASKTDSSSLAKITDSDGSKLDPCQSIASTLSTDSSLGLQSAVRLRSRIKGWAGGKKRKKQGFGEKQAHEQDDSTSDSISALSSSSSTIDKNRSNRPRRRRKKKKKKKNLLRSLANYVRSKPTLPVISEDPDQRDDEEDDATLDAARSVNEKKEAREANVSDGISSSTSKLEREGMQESAKPESASNSEEDGTRAKPTNERTENGHMVAVDQESSLPSALSDKSGIPQGAVALKETLSQRGSDSATSEKKSQVNSTNEPKQGSMDAQEAAPHPEKQGPELGTELTLEMVEMHEHTAARSLDSPSSRKSKNKPNDQIGDVGCQDTDRPNTEIAEEQDGFCITLKVSQKEDEHSINSQRILEELEMIEPHHRSSHTSQFSEAARHAGLSTKLSAMKTRSPTRDRQASEERETWEAGVESGKCTNGPLVERKESKVRRVFARSFFGKKHGKVQTGEEFIPEEQLQAIPQYMPPPGELEKWRSVEKKIEQSLKKAEALASVYGEDIRDLQRCQSPPGASTEFSRTSTEFSRASTEFSPITELSRISTELSVAGFSLPEPASEEWMSVERKIDDTLLKVEKLASRLGVSQRQLVPSE